MPDVYLFTTLGSCFLFFALALFGPARRRNPHFVVSYVCFALAVLAKGPMIATALCAGTLAVYAAVVLDWTPLWRPGTRRATLRCVLAWALGGPVLAAFATLTFVYGASERWWGYNREQHYAVSYVKHLLLGASMRYRLASILLLLICLCYTAVALRWLHLARSEETGRRVRRIGVVVASIASLAAMLGLLLPTIEAKFFAGGLLGGALLVWLLPLEIRRLILRPGLWERVQPWIKPVAVQLGLFAVVLVAVAGPWHLGIVIAQGEGFFTDFIVKHNITRAVEKVNSTGVTDFYIRTLIFGYFPWCVFIPIALASLVGWWGKDPFRRYDLEAFLWITSLVTFVAFSSSRTKFPHYLAPMLIPLAVLIGLAVVRTLEQPRSRISRLTWIAAAMLYLLPMLDLMREGGTRYLVSCFTVKRWVPDELDTAGYSAALLFAFFVLMLVVVLVRSKVVVGALIVVAALIANYYTGTFIPELSKHKSLKGLTDTYRQYAMPDDPIGFRGDMKHGIFFYTSHEVELLSTAEEFMEFLSPARPAFAIVERVDLYRFRTPYSQRYPGHKLYIIDDSHFSYHLITNFPIEGLEEKEGKQGEEEEED